MVWVGELGRNAYVHTHICIIYIYIYITWRESQHILLSPSSPTWTKKKRKKYCAPSRLRRPGYQVSFDAILSLFWPTLHKHLCSNSSPPRTTCPILSKLKKIKNKNTCAPTRLRRPPAPSFPATRLPRVSHPAPLRQWTVQGLGFSQGLGFRLHCFFPFSAVGLAYNMQRACVS